MEEIKKAIADAFVGAGEMHIEKVVFLLLAAGVIGIYLFLIYRNQSKGAFYSKDLNITIAGIPLIVCGILIAMQTSLVVSLGMVGALSIVRFRNAVKSPLDLLYFFWSISAGIMCGVSLVVLALLLCAVMTFMVLLLRLVPGAKASSVLVLRSGKEVDWSAVGELLKKHGKGVRQKSRSHQAGQTEVIYELFTKEENQLIADLEKLETIEQIHFLSHDGEYRV